MSTPAVQRVLTLAREEAQRLGHPHVGTEHILLALVREGAGAARALGACGLAVGQLDTKMRTLQKKGMMSMVLGTEADIPMTRRAERLLKDAEEEAKALGHPAVSGEHLLLALLRQKEGGGARTLLGLGLTLERVRETVLELLKRQPPG